MPQYDPDVIQSNGTNVVNAVKSFSISEVWIIISILLAVIGGILIYSTLFNNGKEAKYEGNKKIIYDFFNFKITIIDTLFKVLYLISAIAITLISFAYITVNFFEFIAIIVFGNIALRLLFEFILMLLKLFKDVSDIRDTYPKKEKKLKKEETK